MGDMGDVGDVGDMRDGDVGDVGDMRDGNVGDVGDVGDVSAPMVSPGLFALGLVLSFSAAGAQPEDLITVTHRTRVRHGRHGS